MGTKSTTKYLVLSGGVPTAVAAVTTSAGAADANSLPALNASGVLDITITGGKQSTAGVADAAKPIYTGADGKLDVTFLPTGIGPDTTTVPASEAITAPALVNIWNDAGVLKARKADAASGKPAHGYIKTTVAISASTYVYRNGTITGLSGLTIGTQWLSTTTPGQPQAAAPTADGTLVQQVGFASSATVMEFDQGTVFSN